MSPIVIRALLSVAVQVLKMLIARYKAMTPEQRAQYDAAIEAAKPRESDR